MTKKLDWQRLKQIHDKKYPFYCAFFYLVIQLLACHTISPIPDLLPTPTPVVIHFTVQQEAVPADGQVAPRVPIGPAPTPVLLQPTPTPLSLSPVSPIDSPTLPPPESEVPATSSPVSSESKQSPVAEALTPAPAASTDNVYSGALTGTIELIDPPPGYVVPVGVHQLEFKWAWHGQEIHTCQLPDGYGFAIRIWANPADPLLPAAIRQAIEPLGVADFGVVQEEIAASCDPKTGIRRYQLKDLKSAPGVALVGGSGHFFWDVAYAQLQPYYVDLGVAVPREFFILADGPTPELPTTLPSPTPAFPLTPQPRPVGMLTLLKPDDRAVYPVNPGPVQFEWRWEGQPSEICQLAPGYGFELRIWSRQPGFGPLGVLDAVKDQDQIQCDPSNGVYSLIVPDFTTVPGVVATFKGDYRWDGQFWWDAALVSTRPYQPPESASAARGFEIYLDSYSGPLDWFGRPYRCSQFTTWPQAQAVFLALGGPNSDPNGLDPDGNRIACDELRQ